MANQNGVLLKAGLVADYVHLLIVLPRTCSPADLVQEIKVGSSKWLKTKADHHARFQWQAGYGIFSISPPIARRLRNTSAGRPSITEW